jgi:hypothetical protein
VDQLRALSVRQPWAHAIVHFGKDIENRTRRFGHRGWTLIHASRVVCPEEWDEAGDWMVERNLPADSLPFRSEARAGGIVGVARIVDSISSADQRSGSPWWMGPFGLVIDQAHPLPFVECKGTVAPLFWRPPGEVMDRLRPALAALDLAA